MARSVEPLVVGKVIGDVVDMFTPATEFTIHYGSKQISNGYEIKPSAAVDKPKVQILGPRNQANLYTLVRIFLFTSCFYFRCSFVLLSCTKILVSG